MTTIAFHYKDNQIAVDSRVTAGGIILTDKAMKIHKCNGVTFVLAGTAAEIEILVNRYPNIDQDLKCYGIIIENNIAYNFYFDDGSMEKNRLLYNLGYGSGEDFAISAMDFGKSAKEAVKYAMTRDSCTGGKINVINLG